MTEQQFWSIAAPYLGEDRPDRPLWSQRRTDRQQVRLRIYCPKDPDANPYYSSNHLLHRCTQAAGAILSAGAGAPVEGEEARLLLQLYMCQTGKAEGTEPEKMIEALLGSECPLVRDFCWFITKDIMKIDRVAGGHRGSIGNDTEIDISALLLPSHSRKEFIEAAEQICRENQALLKIL